MNKSELIRNLIRNNEYLSKDDVEHSINLIIESIGKALSDENRVELRGFGSFSIRKRKKRISRNPNTGKSISVEEKNHPYFRASKYLKESLNK